MVPHFPKMVLAELRAVFGRWAGKGALALSLVIPIVAAFAMAYIKQKATESSINGMPIEQMIDASARGVLDWALTARNLFLLPALLVLSTASAVSGELGDNTLRAVLSRPVSRVSVILAKLGALSALSAASLSLTFLPALIGGLTLWGMPGEDTGLDQVALGYAASWLSDLGLIAMTLLISVFFRSVGGVVVILILYLMVDKAAGLAMRGLGMLGVESAKKTAEFLPGNALACWEGWSGSDGWDVNQFIALGLLFTLCMAGSLVRFQRMDVP
jgi:ABC-type transport system involved in multi-copper enzyme maturation permease subunit